MSSEFWKDIPKATLDELIRLHKSVRNDVPKECTARSEERCLMCVEMGHICEAVWMGEQAYHYDDKG